MTQLSRKKIAEIIISQKEWSDQEWTDVTGISRQTFWRMRNDKIQGVESKTLELMARASDQEIIWKDHTKNQGQLQSSNDKTIGEGGMIQDKQLHLLAQTQQKTIELMDEKIQLLENNIGVDPIANQIWDDIQSDFEFEVAVKIRFSKFDVQKKYTTIGDLGPLSKYTGYSLSELLEIYETEKWHDSSVSGEHSLYSKGSTERLKSMSGIIIKSVGLFKAMVGDHYIPIPITFIAKDGERKRAMSYSKLNIVKMTGSAKFVFLNGPE